MAESWVVVDATGRRIVPQRQTKRRRSDGTYPTLYWAGEALLSMERHRQDDQRHRSALLVPRRVDQ